MTDPEPKSAALIAAEPTTLLPWELVRAALADTRMYWLATVHPDGRPHVRPVLAVWLGGALYTTSADQARKGRNLTADPRCTVTARTENMDVVLEGTAAKVTDADVLHRLAEAYRSKYSWPVTVTDGAFDAPYGAPTAGPPPYHPYEITPVTVYGFGTADEYGGRTTRFRF
jgi:nitroimidazol reductase NimA-like FMN-containing flavoprotein (pyridoxamine 5'-phosphate oxidase superfamily)